MAGKSGHLLDVLIGGRREVGRERPAEDGADGGAVESRAAAKSRAVISNKVISKKARSRASSRTGNTVGEEAGAADSGARKVRVIARAPAPSPQPLTPARRSPSAGGPSSGLRRVFERIRAGAGAAAPVSERPGSSADRAEGGRAREGHLQITYSEAMLFTLLSLVLIIAAYVLGRSSARGAAPGDAGAEEPIQTLSAGQLLPDRGGRSAEVSPRIAAVGKKSTAIWTLRAAEFMGRDKGAAGSLARDLQKRYKHRAWVVPSRRTKGRWEVFCGRFAKSSDPDLAKLEKALTTYRSKSGPGILAKSLERVSIVQ